MSAPEFKSLFNSSVFQSWFGKSLSKSANKTVEYSSFVHTGRAESKSFVNNTIVDFILTKEQLTGMIGTQKAEQVFDTISKDVNSIFKQDAGAEVRTDSTSGQKQIFIKGLKFSTLNKTVAGILDGASRGIGDTILEAISKQKLDRGHVFGFGNTLLERTKEELKLVQKNSSYLSEGNITDTQLAALGQWIDALIDVLEEYDISTSDVKGLDADVYLKYRKTSSNWLIEWQSSVDNSGSGSVVGQLLGRTGAKTFTGARGVFTGKATEEVVTKFVQQFVDLGVSSPTNSKLNLLNMRSSPSMKDMLVSKILSTITGSTIKEKEYTGSLKLDKKLSIASVQKEKSDAKRIVAALKTQKAKLAAAKKKLVAKKVPTPELNLSNLQNLLNQRLHDAIKENMGTGSDKRVLNYRSGRFANSAKVERLSESRQGMITAFYTYMKNPYATFSDGGMQSSPKSRDPKLLIAKSIRDIAGTQVANRLRAVNV